MGFLYWLQMVWVFIAGNPLLMKIIKGLVDNMRNEARELLPFIEQTCRTAMAMPGSGADKFNFVLDAVKAEFPHVAGDLLRSAVQDVYTYLVAPTEVKNEGSAPTSTAGPTSG